VISQNVTEFVTGVCYHWAIKKKQVTSKPSKRMGRKVMGPKALSHGSPTADVSINRFNLKGERKHE
jgi:hypothetical protein